MKEKLKILVMIIFGIIIGIFSKYSDTSGKTFSHYFGILSSGIFLWFFTAALILYLAKNRKSFNLYYLSFMESMLVSYYLYSKKDNKYKKLYITNLIMNYLWPILFFSLKQRILGSILIVALLIETIIYMKNIKKVDNTSFYLLIPYLAWLTFATYLSIGTTLLNM